MKLFANFVSAVWGGALILVACGLYTHSEPMITGSMVALVVSTVVRLLINAEAEQ